jgi:hypothetical protein
MIGLVCIGIGLVFQALDSLVTKSINIGYDVWVVLPSVTTCVRVSCMFGYQSGGKNWTLLPTMATIMLLFPPIDTASASHLQS